MKHIRKLTGAILLSSFFVMNCMAQDTFTVTIDKSVNGSFKVSPAIPADGKVKAGTVLTVTPTPDAGYALDAGYYSVPGRWGQMYTEFM